MQGNGLITTKKKRRLTGEGGRNRNLLGRGDNIVDGAIMKGEREFILSTQEKKRK